MEFVPIPEWPHTTRGSTPVVAPEVVEETGERNRLAGHSEEDSGPFPIHPRARREERIRERHDLLRRRGP
ncbi:hypothetical protein L345_05421, partial [Ophiophagus hannah]